MVTVTKTKGGETTSTQKRAELKRLSKQCQNNIYEMLRLAVELIDDHEYVDSFGGEAQLIEHLEAEEFAHFGGDPTLGEMVRAFRHSPRKATWQEYHFSVRALIELATPAKERAERNTTNWKALAKELQLQLNQLKAENKELRERDTANQQTIGKLSGKLELLEKWRTP